MDARDIEEYRGKPAEDLIPVQLIPGDPEKVTYVGASVPESLKGEFVGFL